MFNYFFEFFDRKKKVLPDKTKYKVRSKTPPIRRKMTRPFPSPSPRSSSSSSRPFTYDYSAKTEIPTSINLCKLTDKTQICNIGSCVKKIIGLPSDSASPTDTWVINFKDNVYYNNIKIDKGFLKIFVSPYTRSISKQRHVETIALDYEINIYKNIIKNLIDYKICPNFIKYLASGTNCTFENMLEILNGNIYTSSGSLISPSQTMKNLQRNMIFLQYDVDEDADKRPEINDNTNLIYKYPPISMGVKYNMIMTEDANAIKFDVWIKNNRHYPGFEKDLWEVLFQIFVACYSMSLSKLVHNDLHSSNIFIRSSTLSKNVLYYINGIPTMINSRYLALVYDFDNGFVEKFGNNPKLVGYFCDVSSQCNTYIENKDIIKILCYVYSHVKNDIIQNKILELLTSNNSYKKELVYTYKNNKSFCFLQQNNYAQPFDFYNKFHNCEIIINNLKKLMVELPLENVSENNIFKCNKKYFKNDGSLNLKEIEKDKYTKIPSPEPPKYKTKGSPEAKYTKKVANKECDNCVKLFSDENIDDTKSFRKWAVKNHPDKGGDSTKFASISNCNDLFFKDKTCDETKIRTVKSPTSSRASSRPSIIPSSPRPSSKYKITPTVPRSSIKTPKPISPRAFSLSRIEKNRTNRIRSLLEQYINDNKIYTDDDYLINLAKYIDENERLKNYFIGENLLTENQVLGILINEIENYNKMDISTSF